MTGRRKRNTGSISPVKGRTLWRARLPGGKGKAEYFKSEADAEGWLADRLSKSTDFDPWRPFGEYLKYWMELREARWSRATRRQYARATVEARDIWPVPLNRVRGNQLQAVLARVIARMDGASYPRIVGSILKRAFRDAVDWGILGRNPAAMLDVPAARRPETLCWSEAEATAYLGALRGRRLEAALMVGLCAGLRKSEILALRWSDLDERAGVVTIREAEKEGVGRPLEKPKRDKVRKVELDSSVLGRLAEIRAGSVPGPFLVSRSMSQRWTGKTLAAEHKAVCLAAKITPLPPHSALRHTAATLMMQAGIPLPDIADMLGHANPAITSSIYLHGSSAGRRRASAALGRLLARPDPAEGAEESG